MVERARNDIRYGRLEVRTRGDDDGVPPSRCRQESQLRAPGVEQLRRVPTAGEDDPVDVRMTDESLGNGAFIVDKADQFGRNPARTKRVDQYGRTAVGLR